MLRELRKEGGRKDRSQLGGLKFSECKELRREGDATNNSGASQEILV